MIEEQVKAEDSELYLEVLEALIDDDNLSELARAIVDGAVRGAEALETVLAAAEGQFPTPKPAAKTELSQPPAVFLQRVVVEGFRGAGPEATLDFAPGPGLTLVVGRNGTGKSTFAEGLETLLTGTTARWEERRQWKDAWKNLGYGGSPRVEATLVAEGVGPCRASRTWGATDDLAAGVFEVDPPTAAGGTLDWRVSCLNSRPFLGYRQLGTVVDKPADVFDTLHEVLGLELLSNASARVNEELKSITRRVKDAKHLRETAGTHLKSSSDERAADLLQLLAAKKPVLSELQKQLATNRRSAGNSKSAVDAFARSVLPSLDEWRVAQQGLIDAHNELRACSSAAAEQSATLVQLLDDAIARLDITPEACPVCLKSLSEDQLLNIRQRRASLNRGSEQFAIAKARLEPAYRTMCGLVSMLPDLGDELVELDLELAPPLTEALQTLKHEVFASVDRALLALASQTQLPARIEALQCKARALLTDQDDEFRRATQPLEQWLDAARRVEQEAPCKKALASAKEWLKNTTDVLREKRFEPFKEAALLNWRTLSSGSSVLLNSVKLSGQGNKRKIDLEVEVDGHGAPGVGVLSQGEINCMALSLFLPKAMHADGPFRFVVIDDPVQAMDQVKVDGLARVLHRAAQKLQVVVLTHDSRLMISLRRLQLPCSVLEVRRSAGSTLTVRSCEPAHERYINDASRLAKQDGLGDEVPRRLVPGFCRLAVEAACSERIFRDHLRKGQTFREIEVQLEGVRSMQNRLALALLGDAAKAAEVPSLLKRSGGRGECEAVFQMKETHGAGGKFTREELITLTRRTRDLCDRVLAQ